MNSGAREKERKENTNPTQRRDGKERKQENMKRFFLMLAAGAWFPSRRPTVRRRSPHRIEGAAAGMVNSCGEDPAAAGVGVDGGGSGCPGSSATAVSTAAAQQLAAQEDLLELPPGSLRTPRGAPVEFARLKDLRCAPHQADSPPLPTARGRQPSSAPRPHRLVPCCASIGRRGRASSARCARGASMSMAPTRALSAPPRRSTGSPAACVSRDGVAPSRR